ncbi:hypothetical protein B0H66DRAFT_593246 [Apodospora peruviana]|uniref:Uncharacterized protein n=1 Tax=Apodospora peruviana TaxID=516989 RepID=A0AAE0M1E5_9PEZI|nr:hypothetical protein B0H66DRAFT_593246 [Apodospora peruviana]
MDRRNADDDDDCMCYVDSSQIHPMPAQGSRDPCVQSCKNHFMSTVVMAAFNDVTGWQAACGKLTSDTPTEQFWPLYWCDSTFCGVQVNQTGGLGQDPMVDQIINTCQGPGIGIWNVFDSGPPPVDFVCQTDKSPGRTACHGSPSPNQKLEPTSQGAASGPTSTSSTRHPTASPTISDAHGVGGAPSTTSRDNLSKGAKIALVVCSLIALLTLILVALLCLRRRHRRKKLKSQHFRSALNSRSHRPIDSHNNFPCRGSAGTPLISPAGSTTTADHGATPPLTPPLRLRDRRLLLPSILRTGGSGFGNRSSDPSPPLTPLTPAYSPNNSFYHHHANGGGSNGGGAFPPSPICAPTTNKLVPRYERTPTPRLPQQQSLPLPQIAFAAAAGTDRGSSGHSMSSLRHEITGTQAPGSPPRPPRPHEQPLEIPDLLTPAAVVTTGTSSPVGPPPSRGLPPPPPPPPPLSPLSQASVISGSFSVSAASADGSSGILTPRKSTATADNNTATMDFMDPLSRRSWGSWDGSSHHHHHHHGNSHDDGHGHHGNGNGDHGAGIGTARSASTPIALTLPITTMMTMTMGGKKRKNLKKESSVISAVNGGPGGGPGGRSSSNGVQGDNKGHESMPHVHEHHELGYHNGHIGGAF